MSYQGERLTVAPPVPGELTQRLYDGITAIQYGQVPDRHGWNVVVEIGQPAAAAQPSLG
jgi:branched-chain amino acid aminotransferase